MRVVPSPPATLTAEIARDAVERVVRMAMLPPDPLRVLCEAVGHATVNAFLTPAGQRWLRKERWRRRYRKRYERRARKRR